MLGQKIRFLYLRLLYDLENNGTRAGLEGFKIAFKLTEAHIDPNGFQKMRVCYAVQVDNYLILDHTSMDMVFNFDFY